MNSGCPGGVLVKTADLGFGLVFGFLGLKVRGLVLHQEPMPARQKRLSATLIQEKGAAPGSNSGAHVALGEASVVQFYQIWGRSLQDEDLDFQTLSPITLRRTPLFVEIPGTFELIFQLHVMHVV